MWFTDLLCENHLVPVTNSASEAKIQIYWNASLEWGVSNFFFTRNSGICKDTSVLEHMGLTSHTKGQQADTLRLWKVKQEVPLSVSYILAFHIQPCKNNCSSMHKGKLFMYHIYIQERRNTLKIRPLYVPYRKK